MWKAYFALFVLPVAIIVLSFLLQSAGLKKQIDGEQKDELD